MLKNILKIFYNYSSLINIYRFLKGGSFFLPRDGLNFKHSKKKISVHDKLFSLPGEYFQEIENKKIDNKIPSVFGWVPFKKNKTNLVIFDFFAANYSIRKQKLLRISLLNENNIISQKLFLFPGYTIVDLDLNKIFSEFDGQSVCVELFHPFIRKNHGGSDGQFRFWVRFHNGKILDNLSTSHSLVLRKKIKFELKSLNGRRFCDLFLGLNNKDYCRSSIFDTFKQGKRVKTFFGFNAIEDEDSNIRSLTHHSHYFKADKNKKLKRQKQCLFIPKIENLNPTIFVDNLETGINKNNICITIFDKDNLELYKESFITNGFFSRSISSFYKLNKDKEYIIVIEFDVFTEIYAHVLYNFGKMNLCDQVHLHKINWNIEKKILSPSSRILGSSRKFGYILKRSNKLQDDFFTLYLGVDKKDKKINFYLRLYTDTDIEEIVKINRHVTSPILNLNIREIFKDLDNKFNRAAIIQLESKSETINGNFMRIDLQNKIISTDHLTGG
jgi:hypothetical protein